MISAHVYAENKCYVFVESSGTYEGQTVMYLSLSLIRQFIEWVEPVPLSGVSDDSCGARSVMRNGLRAFCVHLSW